MKLEYTGPHAAVEVAATGAVVKRGEVVDVPDDVAERLLEQGSFKKAAEPKSAPRKVGE